MSSNTDVWPIVGPLLKLLTSRKGLLWVVSALVVLAIAYVPALEEVRQQMTDVGLAVFGLITTVLIGSIAFEDGQLKSTGKFPVRIDKVDFTPLWYPFVALLRSRKTIAWIAAIFVGFTVVNVPALEDQSDQLTDIYVVVLGVITSTLIGAVAYEDGKTKGQPPTSIQVKGQLGGPPSTEMSGRIGEVDSLTKRMMDLSAEDYDAPNRQHPALRTKAGDPLRGLKGGAARRMEGQMQQRRAQAELQNLARAG